jgi:hypothetical protein
VEVSFEPIAPGAVTSRSNCLAGSDEKFGAHRSVGARGLEAHVEIVCHLGPIILENHQMKDLFLLLLFVSLPLQLSMPAGAQLPSGVTFTPVLSSTVTVSSQPKNVGDGPLKLLVIDTVEKGQSNTVLQN